MCRGGWPDTNFLSFFFFLMIRPPPRSTLFPTRRSSDLIWTAARRLGHGAAFPDGHQSVEDDHAPFLDAGVAATVLIDFDFGGAPGENRYWHTPEDTLDKVSAES